MNEKEILGWLYDHGYFWVPFYPMVGAKKVAQTLRLTSPCATNAVKVLHAFAYSTMNYLAESHYREPHQITGIVRAITELYMSTPRCGLPDFVPPVNAELEYDSADLTTSVQRMRDMAKTGFGSWPSPCQDNGNGITLFLNTENMPSSLDGQITGIIKDVINGYGRRGLPLVWLNSNANILISWEHTLGGRGTIGLAEFNDQTCGDSVFCKMLSSFHPSNGKVAQLLGHEIGHNCNLPHTSNGVMRPNLEDEWNGFSDRDPSVPRLQRYFGTEPVQPDKPDPDTDDLRLKGTTTVELNGKEIGQFIFRPRIDI